MRDSYCRPHRWTAGWPAWDCVEVLRGVAPAILRSLLNEHRGRWQPEPWLHGLLSSEIRSGHSSDRSEAGLFSEVNSRTSPADPSEGRHNSIIHWNSLTENIESIVGGSRRRVYISSFLLFPLFFSLITLHYITLSAFQTPPTPKVTSGASTITCYTKYSPPAQHAG